jgi:DNA-binding protein HU-beta
LGITTAGIGGVTPYTNSLKKSLFGVRGGVATKPRHRRNPASFLANRRQSLDRTEECVMGSISFTLRRIMNKNDLVELLAEEHELTKTFAREVVETVFQSITEAARKGDEVSIFGFGKFRVAERAARKGRNPRTGAAIKIAASKRLKFEPARAMKATLNAKRRKKA